MLRIHLTTEDLLRTRFASQPAPLMETVHAIAVLQRREPEWRNWRRAAMARLPSAARPLFELIPPTATSPCFLDTVAPGLAEGLDAVQRAPAGFVQQELRRLSAQRQPGPFARSLAERDRGAWRDLDRALRTAQRHLIEESWPRILTSFSAEVTWGSRLFAESGVRGALPSLAPTIGWDGTVLQIQSLAEHDLYPGGAGLVLMPSPLWTGRPLVGWQPGEPAVIVYPATIPLPLVGEAGEDPLADLLGHTRAAVLSLALTERTTTEIARELGISAAAASGHTKVLRGAGLIATRRRGKAVLHAVTPLGVRLLENSGHSSQMRPALP